MHPLPSASQRTTFAFYPTRPDPNRDLRQVGRESVLVFIPVHEESRQKHEYITVLPVFARVKVRERHPFALTGLSIVDDGDRVTNQEARILIDLTDGDRIPGSIALWILLTDVPDPVELAVGVCEQFRTRARRMEGESILVSPGRGHKWMSFRTRSK